MISNPQLIRINRLKPEDLVEGFDCGDDDLNDFLLNEAKAYQECLLAATYLVRSKETEEILAYFSLANDRISIGDFPDTNKFNRFRRTRFPNPKRIKSYPAVKLCRLAVSKNAKGMRIGSMLLDYIKYYFIDNNKTGCRFLTVDAYTNAVDFYLRNNFLKLVETEEGQHTDLLFYDLYNLL